MEKVLFKTRHLIGIICRVIFMIICIGVVLYAIYICKICGQPYPEFLLVYDGIAVFCLGLGGMVTFRWPFFRNFLHPIQSTEPLHRNEMSKSNFIINCSMNIFLIAFACAGFWAIYV